MPEAHDIRAECHDRLRQGPRGRPHVETIMTAPDYLDEHIALTRYLNVKALAGDWHAVSDAANDLRVLEARWQQQNGELSTST